VKAVGLSQTNAEAFGVSRVMRTSWALTCTRSTCSPER
jgi:hypothetical protein